MHKNFLTVVGITILFVCVGLSGCQEEKTTEKLVTAPLNTLALTVDDLPYGYYKFNEDFNDTIYGATFFYESQSLFDDNKGYPMIAFSIVKLDSINDTIIFYQNATSANFTNGLNNTTPQDVELIGDESKYELYQGESEYYSNENMSISYLQFRINNFYIMFYIFGPSEPEIEYISFTFDLAKIVESRINSSLE